MTRQALNQQIQRPNGFIPPRKNQEFHVLVEPDYPDGLELHWLTLNGQIVKLAGVLYFCNTFYLRGLIFAFSGQKDTI